MGGQGESMKVLIVDDTPSIRLVLQRFMSRLGYESVLCADGSAAWERLQEETFDVAIVDWVMPVMDGVTLCRKIREHDLGYYLYLILCTGKEERSDLLEGMEAGADDFTVKPLRFDEFSVRMRAAERICELQRKLTAQNRELSSQHSSLEAAYDSMQRDLRLAARSLERLLPEKNFERERLTTRYFFQPSSFLGGDFLNYFPIGSRYLALYIFDVSGHGVPAALKAVTLGRLLDADSDLLQLWGVPKKPSDVVARLNEMFLDDDDYFTLLYGVLDLESLELEYVQAGHPALLLVREGAARYYGEGGFPVSLFGEATFEDQSLKLYPGDRLYLYSDGLTDARGSNGVYGPERFAAKVSGESSSLQETLDHLIEDVRQWSSQAIEDDLTVLVVEI